MKKAFYLPILFLLLLLCSLTQAQTVFKAQVSNNPGIRADQLATPPIGWFVADGQVANFDGTMPEWTPSIGATSFLQSDSTKQPILMEDSLNGHKVVYFDGVNDTMASTINPSLPFSIVIVYAPATNADTTPIQGAVSTWFIGSRSKVIKGSTGFTPAAGGGIVNKNYRVAILTVPNIGSASLYVNGTFAANCTVSGLPGNLSLGILNGNIAEAVITDYVLSSQEITDLTDGMASFYNLTIDDSIIINNTILEAQLSDGAPVATISKNSATLPGTTIAPTEITQPGLKLNCFAGGATNAIEVYDASGSLAASIDNAGGVNSMRPYRVGGVYNALTDNNTITKVTKFDLSGMTAAKTLTVAINQTTTQTLTVPNIAAADSFVTNDTAATLTNKTLDVEGTGNVVTTVDEIWRQAAVMTATSTAVYGDFNWTDLAAAPTPTAINQSNIDLGHLVYSASATNSAVTYYRLPLSWTGNIDIEIIWSSSVGTNAVKWDVATAFGTASNPAFNTSQTVTTTVAGADTDTVSTITGLTTTGAVAGDMMYLKVSRLGADGADTCTGTARLIGVTIKIRRAL